MVAYFGWRIVIDFAMNQLHGEDVSAVAIAGQAKMIRSAPA
ncbi:MAG TPA: hypothetical protein VL171_05655 [Verrucomicrobiae bacterium]|jgi:hypothetical protein|nr:hypothetical protein [Verrucomicrobiae bacterium]